VSKLPVVPYSKLKKIVLAAGFKWVRCEGSHNSFSNDRGTIIVIPDHGHHVIVRPLLRKILRDMGLSIEEYHRLLRKI
jgi:predicted RNA binding protein YcfA (HicA-like mRNA interferase family)